MVEPYYRTETARTATKHMARCFRNPEVRACKSCRHYGLGEYRYECAVDALDDDPTCSQCGELVDPDVGICPNDHHDKPLYQLRVRCEKWESDT